MPHACRKAAPPDRQQQGPKMHLVFSNSWWDDIGTNGTLEVLVSEITGIEDSKVQGTHQLSEE